MSGLDKPDHGPTETPFCPLRQPRQHHAKSITYAEVAEHDRTSGGRNARNGKITPGISQMINVALVTSNLGKLFRVHS